MHYFTFDPLVGKDRSQNYLNFLFYRHAHELLALFAARLQFHALCLLLELALPELW
jgi:hypothetical protein